MESNLEHLVVKSVQFDLQRHSRLIFYRGSVSFVRSNELPKHSGLRQRCERRDANHRLDEHVEALLDALWTDNSPRFAADGRSHGNDRPAMDLTLLEP